MSFSLSNGSLSIGLRSETANCKFNPREREREREYANLPIFDELSWQILCKIVANSRHYCKDIIVP